MVLHGILRKGERLYDKEDAMMKKGISDHV
jgi:hypothetical protein